MKIEIGNKVERIASSTDYTNGRRGTVVELDNDKHRARVMWTEEKDGKPIKRGLIVVAGVRTWVRFSALKKLS